MEENNQKPRLRFKGFTEAWEQRKLGEIGTTYTGLSGKSKEDFGHGNAKFVTYMNVYSNPIAKIEGTENVEIDNSQNKVQYGDAFFTTSSETPDEVGMSSVWLENTNNMYLNSFCFGYRPTEKIEPYYLGYMLRSETMREKLIFLAQGISRYNISKNKVMEIKISLPKYEEQVKIGNFFKHLDNLITLHQRKCDKLVNVKKALLEKMFPNNGKNVPELRFSGFTEAWEQRKLGEIFEYERPDKYIVESEEYSENSNTPVLTANKAFILGYTDEDNVYKKEKESVIFDDFTLDSKFVDFPYMVKSSAIKILTLKNKNRDNLRFSFELLNSTKFDMLGHARHYISVVQPREVLTPNKQEQDKISQVFESLDNLITLHQHKLEKLKDVKKSLLDKMFV